jgi:hypothetical protein
MWEDYFAAKVNTVNFDNLIENEQEIVLNSFEKNVQFIRG